MSDQKTDAPNGVTNGDVNHVVTAPESAQIVNGHTNPEEEKAPEGHDPPRHASPITDTSSPVSSVDPDQFGDEIVVGTNANGTKPSPVAAPSEHEDEEMADVDEEPILSHYPKRKRPSMYNDLGEDKLDTTAAETEDAPPAKRGRVNMAATKGVQLGYWRDSTVPDEEGKHAVVGFMDIRDRLRTRIQTSNRAGQPIDTAAHPVPPGPGGSWVTFHAIVFDSHLVGLDHNQVKEYVKIRADAFGEDVEVRTANRKNAAKEAIRRLNANPPPETAVPPQIAYGRQLPDGFQRQKPEQKRRRSENDNGISSPGGSTAPLQRLKPTQTARNNYAVTRPTRILIGAWSRSPVEDYQKKNAVFGILGANDMFRVKLVKEAVDGSFAEAHFPPGAGALWIQYDEVIFLPHLSKLPRQEIKEYCRVRQEQLDAGEREEDRATNERLAVEEAQVRAARKASGAHFSARQIEPPKEREVAYTRNVSPSQETRAFAPRPTRRESLRDDGRPVQENRHSRYSLPEADIRSTRQQSTGVERTNSLADREVRRLELAQERDDRHQANRRAVLSNDTNRENNHAAFNDNIQRMQRVWTSQEVNRAQASNEEMKIHGGVKYERRQNGPFAGKLVSHANLITIDGEDYVEYRVLTKPTFF